MHHHQQQLGISRRILFWIPLPGLHVSLAFCLYFTSSCKDETSGDDCPHRSLGCGGVLKWLIVKGGHETQLYEVMVTVQIDVTSSAEDSDDIVLVVKDQGGLELPHPVQLFTTYLNGRAGIINPRL